MSDSRSGSDDEAPEQMSFDSSKAKAQQEAQLVSDVRRKDKEILKQKRRERQELFKKQKVDKETRSSKLLFTDAILDQIRSETNSANTKTGTSTESSTGDKQNQDVESNIGVPALSSEVAAAEVNQADAEAKRRPIVKTYRSLNIDVKSLNRIQNPRRMAAVNFKEKRFAKVHRESVSMNTVHLEKLKASGKL